MFAIVAAINIVLRPTIEEIIGNPITLFCVISAIWNSLYLVQSVNLAMQINDATGKVQAGIFNDIIVAATATLNFEKNVDAETRARLRAVCEVLENMRYDALHFPTPMKVLTIPVTKELRVKIFGLLISLAVSTIVRLAQQYVM
jgi:hypothetical protein